MLSIPSKDETFRKLGQLKGLWYESLYSAILDTKEHYKANADHRYDQPQLFGWHVRSRFLTLLEPHTEAYNFSIVSLCSGSFLVVHDSFACKFRRAFNGHVPLPTTKTQLKFYNANDGLSIWPTLPGMEFMRTIPADSTVSLIVYYEVTPNFELNWVKISCPRFATFKSYESIWDGLIPNPLNGSSEDLRMRDATKERKDLSFSLLEDDNSSTELA